MTNEEIAADDSASAEVCVGNELGLHARPAARLAREAQRFACDIALVSGGQQVDAKSILDILTLAAAPGSAMTIRATGRDASLAVRTISELFNTRFGEEK
nr:HPr family phosphocarrier protein [Desulfocurvus vexinensis]